MRRSAHAGAARVPTPTEGQAIMTASTLTNAAATALVLAAWDADRSAAEADRAATEARNLADASEDARLDRIVKAAALAAYADVTHKAQARLTADLVAERNVSRSGAASFVSRTLAAGRVMLSHDVQDPTEARAFAAVVSAAISRLAHTPGASQTALVDVMCKATTPRGAELAARRYFDALAAAKVEPTESGGTESEATESTEPAAPSMHDLVVAFSGPVGKAVKRAGEATTTDAEIMELLGALTERARLVLAIATGRGLVKAPKPAKVAAA